MALSAMVGTASAAMALIGTVGCTAEEEVPAAVVKPVTAYGLTLDDTAAPKQVAFALLQSIADDVRAAQAYDTKRQKEMLAITHSLAAFSTIEARISPATADPSDLRAKEGETRDKKLYAFVKDWAPIVAHYIRSFDSDFQTAAARMLEVRKEGANTAHIMYDVCHDPAETDPAKQQKATIDIELAREPAGALSYWRVARLAFVPPTVKPKPATRSTTASAPHG